jgi:hypothetical protein
VEESREWRARAEARYDELLAHHPEAFADHACEFWLEAGADPIERCCSQKRISKSARHHGLTNSWHAPPSQMKTVGSLAMAVMVTARDENLK